MSKKMRSNILLLITAAIWGSSFVAQKSGMDYIEPFTYNGIRTLIGGLVLIPVIYVFSKKNAHRRRFLIGKKTRFPSSAACSAARHSSWRPACSSSA